MKALACVIVVSLTCPVAAAQTLYKSTMPDGKVIYSEKPAPGAKRVDTIDPPPAKTGTTTVTPQEQARAQAQSSGAAQQADALQAARAELNKAQAALEAGKEPLPGERLGTAGGASRLTEAYFERQKSLELAVDAARKRVQELERAR